MLRLSRTRSHMSIQRLQQCVSKGDATGALDILTQLEHKRSELSPECVVLAARAAVVAHWSDARTVAIWSRMEKLSFKPGVHHYASILKQHARLGSAEGAVKWFEKSNNNVRYSYHRRWKNRN